MLDHLNKSLIYNNLIRIIKKMIILLMIKYVVTVFIFLKCFVFYLMFHKYFFIFLKEKKLYDLVKIFIYLFKKVFYIYNIPVVSF